MDRNNYDKVVDGNQEDIEYILITYYDSIIIEIVGKSQVSEL